MKLKKILSSVLVAIMLFSAVAMVIPPVKADAAYVSVGSSEGTLTQEEIVNLVGPAKNKVDGNVRFYNFNSAQEMFEYELGKGYLVGVKLADAYSLYVNRYTGYVYYKNEITGEMLTSNPWKIDSNIKGDTAASNQLTSQLIVYFIETASAATVPTEYASSRYAAAYSQISVSPILNGFRVNYSIGDTSDRVLLPAGMVSLSFEEKIITPLIESFVTVLEKHEIYEKFEGFGNDDIQKSGLSKRKYNELKGRILGYDFDINSLRNAPEDPVDTERLTQYITDWHDIYVAVLTAEYGKDYSAIAPEYNEIYSANQAADQISLRKYTLYDPVGVSKQFATYKSMYDKAPNATAKEQIWNNGLNNQVIKLNNMFQNFPITGHWEKDGKVVKVYEDGAVPVAGVSVYLLNNNSVSEPYEKLHSVDASKCANYIKKYIPTYTVQEMLADEKEAGCEMPITPKAVFKVSLEYTLGEDGNLKVELPANSISFDESKYTLTKISVLDMFGAVRTDSTEETYAFFPDGSGMVSRFADYTAVSLSRPLYGTDYTYSDLRADFNYLEQVTAPVIGMVSGDTGFVAVVEEGSALAELNIYAGRTHKYAMSYISVQPYPQDKFDITMSTSVNTDIEWYSKTAETRYDGSYTMKIAMLNSDADAQAAMALYNTTNLTEYKCYVASYVGMANCYRDYLIRRGDIAALAETTSDLPLYIEALGSMEYIKKILSFPVNSSLALTEFSDIVTMYNELSSCVETLMEKAKQKDADAEATENLNEKVNCQEEAEEYRRLAGELADFSGISNINFKLTGFANNGLSYTYPTKVKWERVCGGKSGFRELIATATDKNFGVYPDFDFMYIINTAMFDGVGTNGYISRQIDNRYASKQIYDPATGMYFPGFSSVVAADIIPELFAKFEGRYADYDWKYISLSTMGSTLNSDFDERDSVHREDSLGYVTSTLASAKDKEYSIMVDKGNAYTYKYVDHIIDIDTDSSHHIYCSYTVPFIGMVLHGYKNYAGAPINYSGSSDYDILRSIESGANLLYILCYRNTSYMKEYYDTNQYYSVDYNNWYTDILLNYKELNEAIGGELQNYVISDHRIITAEKVINSAQVKQNYALVRQEFLEMIEKQLNSTIDDAYMEMATSNPDGYVGINLVTIDNGASFDLVASLVSQFESIVNTSADAALASDIMAIVEEIRILRGHNEATGKPVVVENIKDYESNTKYDFYTDSDAFDKDYDVTDNTVLNNNVVSVTYTSITDPTKQVTFLLNFNIYAVNVMVDGQIIPLDRYEYFKM